MTTRKPMHPIASLFREKDEAWVERRAESVKLHGQRDSIKTIGGLVIVGEEIERACILAGVEPRYEEIEESDPLTFIIDHNNIRCQYNDSQLALIGARLANMHRGNAKAQRSDTQICVSQEEAAQKLGVSHRLVSMASRVIREAAPGDVEAIEAGFRSLNAVHNELPREADVPNGDPVLAERQWRELQDDIQCLRLLNEFVDLVDRVPDAERWSLINRLVPELSRRIGAVTSFNTRALAEVQRHVSKDVLADTFKTNPAYGPGGFHTDKVIH